VRRRLAVVLVAFTAAVALVGLRPSAPALAYNTECCPWRNPTNIYVGVYGQGVPPYLMDAIGQALGGWNGTSMGFVWEDRSDYNAQVIVVPYWQNASSLNGGKPWSGLGGCKTLDSSGRWCVHGEVDLNLDNSTSASWLMLDQDDAIRPMQVYSIEHEIGHVIGLDHSCKNVQIMTGPASPCPNNGYYIDHCGQYNQPACPTIPQNDDVQGVNALYPGGNSNGSHGCAGTAPPLNPNSLPFPTPSPAPSQSPLPSLPPLPTALPTVPLPTPPSQSAALPDWVPTTPTPIPGVTTDPTQYYPYQNGMDIAQQTEQNPQYPAQLGEAETYNQVARVNGLWPSGQQVHVAPIGTDNLPAVGAADIQYDYTLPSVNRPC